MHFLSFQYPSIVDVYVFAMVLILYFHFFKDCEVYYWKHHWGEDFKTAGEEGISVWRVRWYSLLSFIYGNLVYGAWEGSITNVKTRHHVWLNILPCLQELRNKIDLACGMYDKIKKRVSSQSFLFFSCKGMMLFICSDLLLRLLTCPWSFFSNLTA